MHSGSPAALALGASGVAGRARHRLGWVDLRSCVGACLWPRDQALGEIVFVGRTPPFPVALDRRRQIKDALDSEALSAEGQVRRSFTAMLGMPPLSRLSRTPPARPCPLKPPPERGQQPHAAGSLHQLGASEVGSEPPTLRRGGSGDLLPASVQRSRRPEKTCGHACGGARGTGVDLLPHQAPMAPLPGVPCAGKWPRDVWRRTPRTERPSSRCRETTHGRHLLMVGLSRR